MKKSLFLKMFIALIYVLIGVTGNAQLSAYVDSTNQYQQQYVQKHEVVLGDDKSYMQFFPVSEKYRVTTRVEPAKNSEWFLMESSGPTKKMYRVYATAYFHINDTAVQLNIYQSQSLMQTTEYRDHLFLPFTDASSGTESYPSGRYIDLQIADIANGSVVIDFNKAYNPYCAYVSGKYNCPIPPKENRLRVNIPAGEKIYSKH